MGIHPRVSVFFTTQTMPDACRDHLRSALVPSCGTSALLVRCSDACCAAAASLPNPVACSARWALTAAQHAEYVHARCACGRAPAPRPCLFATAAALDGSPCDAEECAALWAAGEMDAECTARIAAFCGRHGNVTAHACAWYAEVRPACRTHVRAASRNATAWFACAAVSKSNSSLVELALRAKQNAALFGQATLDAEAFAWLQNPRTPGLIGFARADGSVRISATAATTDPFVGATTTPLAIAMPIVGVVLLVYFAVLDHVRRFTASRPSPRRTPPRPA